MNKKKALHNIFTRVERNFDKLKSSRRKRKGAEKGLQILCYNGYRTDQLAILEGRVLLQRDISESNESDDVLKNVRRSYQLFYSKEISGIKLIIRIENEKFHAVSDDEGYIRFEIPTRFVKNTNDLWQGIEVSLNDDAFVESQARSDFQGVVRETEFIIVSDIDDTILQSGAHSKWAMIKNTFAKNATTRNTFEGVSKVYQSLQKGNSDRNINPIFYLSNSPWNLYEYLIEFIELQEIPKGTLFLRDWGIDENKWLKDDGHKLRSIRLLIEQFPKQSFIFIGDSGEKDPEYYYEIALEFPKRVKAIYIRNVTDKLRAEGIAVLVTALEKINVPMLLIDRSDEIEDHAKTIGCLD